MQLQQRTRDEHERDQPLAPAGTTPGGNLAQLRLAGGSVPGGGADAIDRALSSDSEKFLEANTQQGGQ